MKNKNEEYSDFERFKRKAQKEDNYFLTIFYDDNLITINLSEYKKTFFTFGKDEDNDIVIQSEEIDFEQGYFEVTEYGILAVNTGQPINKVIKDCERDNYMSSEEALHYGLIDEII